MKHTSIMLVLLFSLFSCKNTKEKEITTKQEVPTFSYSPKKPVNGKLLGVVELGAAGFNSFIINIDKDLNWQTVKKEFGTSLIVEGMTNTDLVNQKLRDYIEKITAFGLSKKDIHFVVSSGASKEEITLLISKELEKIGFQVNNVTLEEEGIYALQSILPKKFEKDSFLVDIGSGSTKISYYNSNGLPITLETHGAKYYQKGIENEDVFNTVKDLVIKVPIEKRKQCFMVGGVPYRLAKSLRKGEERYTVLNTRKIENSVKKEKKKVKCGVEIYKAIQEGAMPETIVFDWDANFTIGFLIEKNKL